MIVVDRHAHLIGKPQWISEAAYMPLAQIWAAKEPDRKPEMILPKLLNGIADGTGGKMFLDNMDAAGVDISFLLASDVWIRNNGQEPPIPFEKQLEELAEVQQTHKDRLYVWVYVDPRRPKALELFARAIDEYGFKGCGEISAEGFNLDDELIQPMFKKCADSGIPVDIHIRSGMGVTTFGSDVSVNNASHPEHVKKLAKKYPEMKIFIAHSGYSTWWQAAIQTALECPNCYLDLSDWNYDLPNMAEFVAKLAAMRDTLGAERILFSSDQISGPRFCGEKSTLPQWVNFFKTLPEQATNYGYHFTQKEVDLILGGNAQKLFNLPSPTKK